MPKATSAHGPSEQVIKLPICEVCISEVQRCAIQIWHQMAASTWAGLGFKPIKSRFLVLKKRRATDQFHFLLGDAPNPSVTEKPVKNLDTSNLKDTAAHQATSDDLSSWLSIVDRSELPGKFKAWTY